MKKLRHFMREANAPFYRSRPWELFRLTYAKMRLRSHHVSTPEDLVRLHNIDIPTALEGFDSWRPILEATCETVRTASGHQGGIRMDRGVVLYACVRFLRPEVVIETGVGPGVSTSFLLAGLIDNAKGRLYSIELPTATGAPPTQLEDGASFTWQDRGVGWAIPRIIRERSADCHSLMLQDVRDALPRLVAGLDHLDIFFHDDLHTPNHMRWEYELVWPHLRGGGLLISDDVNWGWLAFCRHKTKTRDLYLSNVQRLAFIQKEKGS